MKKHLLLNVIFFSVISSAVYAQNPPNNSFENWTTVTTYEDPVGWTTYNSFTPATPTTVKATPAFEGSFAMKLQVVNDPLLGANTGYAEGGFSMNTRPTTLGWYSKCNIALTGDSVSLGAVFYLAGSPIGAAIWSQGASVANYTQVIVPISYINSSTPDSAVIYIWAGDDLNFVVGTNLVIDKIEFDPVVSAGIVDHGELNSVQLFPNPVNNKVMISLPNYELAQINTKIYNAQGQLILSEVNLAQEGSLSLNVADLPAGIYYIDLESEGIKTQGRFVKE